MDSYMEIYQIVLMVIGAITLVCLFVKAVKGECDDVDGIDNIEHVALNMMFACDKTKDTFSESDVDEVIELMERYEEEGEPGSCYLNFSAF